MENIEEKISTVLNNPQLMQQIMSMAQSLGQSQPPMQEECSEPVSAVIPGIDIAAIQKISGLLQHAGVDGNQKALLAALTPYISKDRVARLERAMRAAKIARQVSSMLGKNNLSLLTGR